MASMRTLIVDDHEILRMGLCALLDQMDVEHDFLEASTLQQALEYVNDNNDIDLILVDYNLPDGNGLELISHVKNTHLHCHILVMSGNETHDLAVKAMVAGANGFLPKSYVSKEVKTALLKVMNGEFFIPEKLQKTSEDSSNSHLGKSLLTVAPSVLDVSPDPVIIFENNTINKLEYINQAAIEKLGLKQETVGEKFKLENYIVHPPLLEFLADPSRSSFLENEITSDVFNKTEQWYSMSCCKIDFLGTPSVMFNLHDITELKLREKDLTLTSNTDPLTELLNRRGFYSSAKNKLEKCKRLNQSASLAMCDLDFFKKLNDNYGHDFGDDILKLFSSVCHDTFRKQDLQARFGGEEFVILLTNIGFSEAISVVERMRENWEKTASEVNGIPCQSTVSIGITTINLETTDINDESLDDAIKRADQLLYKCKELGRNRVEH